MISALYISISAYFIFWLSLNVIKLRRKHRVSTGDGGNEALQLAIAAQSNAIEYIPITLLLLFSLETNSHNMWMIHVFGVMLILGRVIHARGLTANHLKRRVLGMKMTLYNIIALAIMNIMYLPYGDIFTL